MDRNAALADMRYDFIERVCGQAVIKCKESREHKRSVRIDSVLTNKYLAIPAFLVAEQLIKGINMIVIRLSRSEDSVLVDMTAGTLQPNCGIRRRILSSVLLR